MYLRPCRNCLGYKDCDDYAFKLKMLRGLGITSVKFKCEAFLTLYKPGDRVEVLIGERFQHCKGEDNISGTIMNTNASGQAGKLLVCLDEEPFYDEFRDEPIVSRNPFFSFWPKYVIPLGEPPVKVCSSCGIPEGIKHSDGFDCIECNVI